MALLNYVNTYAEVSDKLQLTPSDTGDYIKLYLTKDGHLITHGVDYIPWGTGTIPINKLPVDNTKTDDSHLWDSKTINDKINNSFVANSAMRFKGTIGLVSGSTTKFTINGTEAAFPSSSAEVGDTYRVVSKGTYAGQLCEVGDLLICITQGNSSTAATWTVAQTNINGYVSNKINNVVRTTYSNDSEGYTIYAPTTSGSANQILISGGTDKTPVWQNPAAITVGTASKVIGTLSTTGSGLKMSANYNGSTNVTIQLVAATTSSLGGVWVDNSEKPTISISNGKIYLTADNIKNALGYDPAHMTYNVVSNEADGLAPRVINTNTNLITQAFYLLASSDGQATPSWYKFPTNAFANTWRTIKVGGTSIGTQTLNFVPTGDIYVKTSDQNHNTTDEFDIGFGLAWYNVSTGKYEYE